MAELSAAVLTRRELEIARLVAEGLTNRVIAGKLDISMRTVDAHVDHVFRKTGIRNRVRLMRWLREQVAATTAETETDGE